MVPYTHRVQRTQSGQVLRAFAPDKLLAAESAKRDSAHTFLVTWISAPSSHEAAYVTTLDRRSNCLTCVAVVSFVPAPFLCAWALSCRLCVSGSASADAHVTATCVRILPAHSSLRAGFIGRHGLLTNATDRRAGIHCAAASSSSPSCASSHGTHTRPNLRPERPSRALPAIYESARPAEQQASPANDAAATVGRRVDAQAEWRRSKRLEPPLRGVGASEIGSHYVLRHVPNPAQLPVGERRGGRSLQSRREDVHLERWVVQGPQCNFPRYRRGPMDVYDVLVTATCGEDLRVLRGLCDSSVWGTCWKLVYRCALKAWCLLSGSLGWARAPSTSLACSEWYRISAAGRSSRKSLRRRSQRHSR